MMQYFTNLQHLVKIQMIRDRPSSKAHEIPEHHDAPIRTWVDAMPRRGDGQTTDIARPYTVPGGLPH